MKGEESHQEKAGAKERAEDVKRGSFDKVPESVGETAQFPGEPEENGPEAPA